MIPRASMLLVAPLGGSTRLDGPSRFGRAYTGACVPRLAFLPVYLFKTFFFKSIYYMMMSASNRMTSSIGSEQLDPSRADNSKN